MAGDTALNKIIHNRINTGKGRTYNYVKHSAGPDFSEYTKNWNV